MNTVVKSKWDINEDLLGPALAYPITLYYLHTSCSDCTSRSIMCALLKDLRPWLFLMLIQDNWMITSKVR